MTRFCSKPSLISLTIVATLGCAVPAAAQVAGMSTTVDTLTAESTQLALGWSVKKSLMDKTLYNDADQKVGKVEDLIISPEGKVSYAIVGAGGFVGIGQHDVAIPVTQIQLKDGKLVMPGATRDTIKRLPEFSYATAEVAPTGREQFIAATDEDIARGRAKVAELKNQAGAASAEAKAKLDQQAAVIDANVKAAEAKLNDLKQAAAARWKAFEADVRAATARLRQSIGQGVD